MGELLASGELVVVETEEDCFIGTAEVVGTTLLIRSGFVGRPAVIAITDVEVITPARLHPLVQG